MRLNLASGDDHRDGWVNVDVRCGDVRSDVTHLPFADEAFDEVLADDILEHFWVDRHQELLAEWGRVLRAGGRFTVRTPNLEALSRLLLDRPDAEALLVRNIYGGHRWGPDGAWDTHHWGWLPATLEALLSSAGFTVDANDRGINMTVSAKKDSAMSG